MKTLLLLRHAKAVVQEQGMTDHQRPLAPRGEREAPRLGHWLKQRRLTPDLVITSNAARALATAELVADACDYAGQVRAFRELYLALPETYLQVVRESADDAACVLVVGHNPGLDHLLYALCGEHDGFPTAGLAVVRLDVEEWSQVALPTRHRLLHFVRGKELDES